MDAISWTDGTPNQVRMLASNPTIQNDSRFQWFISGGQINGNPNMYGTHSQATQNSNYQTLHYTSHNGQIANGNYWNGKNTDVNSVQICDGFAGQRNSSGLCEPGPQLPLRNQTLVNGNDNCNIPSGPCVSQYHYATHRNPLQGNAPETVMANGTNSQMTCTTPGDLQYMPAILQSSRFGSGAPPMGTEGAGNNMAVQNLQRIANVFEGESVNPFSNTCSSMESNPNRHYFRATAVTEPGVMARVQGSLKKSKTKGSAGSSDAVAPPTGQNMSLEKALVDRGRDTRGRLALAILNRSRGPFVSSPAGTACPPSGQSRTWPASSDANTGAAQETGNGSGTVSMIPERINDVPPRSSALPGAFCGNANLPYSSVNGNQSSSQGGALSSTGNSLLVQNVMEQQPSYCQSRCVSGNLPANVSCTEKQSYHFSLAGQQLSGSVNPGWRQDAKCHTQSSNGKAFCFTKTLSSSVGITPKLVGSTQMAKPAPSQIPLSNVESPNGHSRALLSGNQCTAVFPHGVKQPHRPLTDEQHAGAPPSYPKTQRYVVTVTQERPGTGFTAQKVMFMADNFAPTVSEPLTSKEKTAKLDTGLIYGELPGSSDPKNCETQLSSAITRAESGFNMAKPTNQLKCTGSSGQRAVAVVPPISQQSSHCAVEGVGFINTNDGLPFKIKNVWSLSEKEYATQQKIVNGISVFVPQDPGLCDDLEKKVLSTSTPVARTDSEDAASSLQIIAQAPDLVSPSSIDTKYASSVSEKDVKTSNPHVASQAEEMHGSNLNLNSETLPSLSVIESSDQNGESKRNNFDLSSMPVFEWTIGELRKLVSVLDDKKGPLQVEMDIDKLHSIYKSYPDLSDVFGSDLYMSIMNEASSVSPQDEHAVIFSQIRRGFHKELVENCHILTHDATYSNDTVYKSSWLNLNEQLDDIDKEHGFPLDLRFRQHILKEKHKDKEVSQSENGNVAQAPVEQETEKRPMPSSPKGDTQSKDQRSSIEINVFPSEEVNDSENGMLAEAAIEKEAEKRAVPPLPTQAELPAFEEGVNDFKDPLSSIEISVLSSEDARRLFGEISDAAKDVHSEVREPDSEGKGSQMEAEPLKEKGKSQMEVYCCLARWLCVMTGYGNRTVCSCQEAESNLVKRKPGTTDNVVAATQSLQGDPSVIVGTDHSVHNSGTANLCEGNNVKGSKCTTLQRKSVGHPENDSLVCEGGNLGDSSEEKAAARMKAPSDHSGVENHAEPPPTCDSSGLNVMELEIQDLCSSCNDISTMASAVSAPLQECCVSKDPPHMNMDGNDCSSGSTRAGNVPFRCNEEVTKCGTFSRPVGSQAAQSPKRTPVLKHLASNQNCNRTDENIVKKESVCRKRKREISNPKSSASDLLASDLQKRNKKKKNCYEAVPETKTTVAENKSRTSREEKCEVDSESLRPKVPKQAKSERLRNVPANGDEKEKTPTKVKVLLVLSKRCERASSVSLALYGSSPQKRNGTLRSLRQIDSKSAEIKSSCGTIPPPPTTINFNVPLQKTSPPVKSNAKQQVFARWKSSLVLEEYDHLSNPQNSKRMHSNKAKVPRVTTRQNQAETPTGQTSAPLPQPVVAPIKLKAVAACQKKKNKKMCSTLKSPKNELPSKPDDHIRSKRTPARRERHRNLPAGPLFKLNKFKLEKNKPKPVEPRLPTGPDTEIRTKYELRNPALIPEQQENGMLEFKLLPESFSFKDGEDHKESVEPKDMNKAASAKIDGQQSEGLMMKTWKVQGSWSKSLEGNDIASPEARSTGASIQSGTAFQEYKKKYMAMGKM